MEWYKACQFTSDLCGSLRETPDYSFPSHDTTHVMDLLSDHGSWWWMTPQTRTKLWGSVSTDLDLCWVYWQSQIVQILLDESHVMTGMTDDCVAIQGSSGFLKSSQKKKNQRSKRMGHCLPSNSVISGKVNDSVPLLLIVVPYLVDIVHVPQPATCSDCIRVSACSLTLIYYK